MQGRENAGQVDVTLLISDLARELKKALCEPGPHLIEMVL
jgi:hypothetical protein